MLIATISEISKSDLDKYTYSYSGTQYIRFCVDVLHEMIAICDETEDHIDAGIILLDNDGNKFSSLQQAARLLCDRVVGGSIYPQDDGSADIVLGGSSIEQQFREKITVHTSTTITRAKKIILELTNDKYSLVNIRAMQ